MRSARLTAAALLVVVATLLPAGAAGAARLATAGWWWRAQTGQGVALPAPPHVPEGGLAVGNGADGPTAVSALRFHLDTGEIGSVLELEVAEDLSGSDVALVACPAGSPWFGSQAGNWGERPEAACSQATVNGAPSDDGSAWSFALGPLGEGSEVDVVILPAPDSSAPFDISFEPPGPESLKVTRRPPPAGPSSGFEADDEPFPSGSTSPGTFETFDPSPAGGTTVPAPGSEEPRAAATEEEPPRQRFVVAARDGSPAPASEPDPRLLAVIVLVSGLIAAAMLRGEPMPAPRLLGPMAGREGAPVADEPATPRGLGRFRRERTGEPPSLR